MTWAAFVLSLTAIIVVSRRNLSLGIICGALVLGFMTLSPATVWAQIVLTLGDSSILLLAAAMGLIPLLGGTMKAGGQVDSLINNVRLPRRYLMPFSAALMGLLPMPGGALLSAPLLEKAGEGVAPDIAAAVNNWFRHLFILVYPLGPALIVATKICDLDIYLAILYILPVAALAMLLGYLWYLRRIDGRPDFTGRFSFRHLAPSLLVILTAPVLDFVLKRLFDLGSLATLIGVMAALTLSILLSRRRIDLIGISRRMKPWNFALIIIGMFLYLHVFQQSDARLLIAAIPLPILPLSIVSGVLLGMLTGRVQLPASVVFPVYIAVAGQVAPTVFALIYSGIYFGYIISPVHPCLVVTCEYFGVSIKTMIQRLAWPTIIVVGALLAASQIVN